MTHPQPRQRFDWAGLGWAFLFFWYFSAFTHSLILLGDGASFTGFRQALLMSVLWLAPVLAFPRQARGSAALIGVLLALSGLGGLGYWAIYGQEFSQSVIFILFESNVAEGLEYARQYLNWQIPLLMLAYLTGGWLLWRKVRPLELSAPLRVALPLAVLAAVIGYPLLRGMSGEQPLHNGLAHLEKRMEPALPWQLLVGYHQYRTQLDNMQQLLQANRALPPLQHFEDAHAGEPSTIVMVIGESTNRQRMALYGYGRDTSPQLLAMRDELDVFQNLIAPRPYTIETLQQVLTFADQRHPDDWLSTPSALNMMKQAGYKTFWITNQQTMTKRNTLLTTFSQQADQQVYLNNNRAQNARSYDDVVLAPFQQMLADPAPRKFIVVHLLGTHMTYDYRYPASATHFSGRDGVPDWVSDDELATYNSYDNAVRFNDHVVASLIQQFAATDPNGLLMYFSDHGEAVYDTPGEPVLGRNEGKPTAAMYTVPFVVWRSTQWKQQHPADWSALLERPYPSMNMIHTLADLAGLSFDRFDAGRSIVSRQYREMPLWIGCPCNQKTLKDFREATGARMGHPLARLDQRGSGAGLQAQ